MTYEEICNLINTDALADELCKYLITNAEQLNNVTVIDDLATVLLHNGYKDKFENLLSTIFTNLKSKQKVQVYSIFPTHLALFHLQKIIDGTGGESDFEMADNYIAEASSLEPQSPLMMVAKTYSLLLKPDRNDKDIEIAKNHLEWIMQIIEERRSSQTQKDRNRYDISILAKLGNGFIAYYLKQYDEALKIFKDIFVHEHSYVPQVRLGIGYCFLMQRKSNEAEAAFRAVLKKFPNNPYAMIGIAITQFYSQTEQGTVGAVQQVKNALKLYPDFAPALLLKAEMLFKRLNSENDYKTIKHTIKKAFKFSGKNNYLIAESLFHNGRVKHAQGDIKGAEESFKKVIEYNPKHNKACYFLGIFALQRGEIQNAIKYLDIAAKEYHDLFEVNAALGLAYAELYQNNIRESVKGSKSIEQKMLNYLEAAISYGDQMKNKKDLINVYVTYGWVTLKLLIFEKAEKAFDSAIKILKEMEQDPPENILLFQGISKYQREKYDEALKIFLQCKDQSQPILRYNIGLCHEHLYHIDEACKIYRKLHQDFPTFAEPLLQLSSIAVRDSRPNVINKDAKKSLEKIVGEIDPKNIQAWIQLAEVNARSKQLKEAQSHMQKALEISGGNDGFLYAKISIGNYFLEAAQKHTDPVEKRKRIEKAKKEFLLALTNNHNCVSAANGLAICWLLLGHVSEAKEHLLTVKDYRGDLPSSYENLGLAYMYEDSYSQALTQFEEANRKFFDKTDINLLLRSYYASKAKKDLDNCLEIAQTLCLLRPEMKLHWYLLGSSIMKVVLYKTSQRALANVTLRPAVVKQWKDQIQYALKLFKKLIETSMSQKEKDSISEKIEITEKNIPRLNDLLKKAKEAEKFRNEKFQSQIDSYSQSKQIPSDIEQP